MCFFRAPPRIVKGSVRELSKSPSLGSRGREPTPTRLFHSPILLSDAVRRLAMAARDRDVTSFGDIKSTDDVNSISRIMSNIYSYPTTRRFSDSSRPSEERADAMSLLPTRRSMVYIRDSSAYIGIDMAAAGSYVYTMTNPLDWCRKNAEIAKLHGRSDHERFFSMLHVLIADSRKRDGVLTTFGSFSPLMFKVFEKM